jgi:leucyl/phenylalanyl-tRNA---protein transferase
VVRHSGYVKLFEVGAGVAGCMAFDLAQVIQAYSQGYFLMAGEEGGDDLGWYSSRQRTLIPLDDRFRYPRSLQRVLNQQRFEVRINSAFSEVVAGCSDREETWISEELKTLYFELNQAGWAHSFETWQGDRLAGGILGIAIGGVLIGESMFFNIPEGSKAAMVLLVKHLRHQKFEIFDAQMMNPHLERFGAYIIQAKEYEKLLKKAIALPRSFM